MSWKIIWSHFAERQIVEIHNYYIEETHPEIAQKMVFGIIQAPNILIQNPQIGQIEFLLSDLPLEYRYILFRSYKIIYSLDWERKEIRIADVFDTRQNPSKLKREK